MLPPLTGTIVQLGGEITAATDPRSPSPMRIVPKVGSCLHPTNKPYDECDEKYCSENAAADVHNDLR
jgi:hypothetical protein